MPTSLIEGNSLLAIDIGSSNTRAMYFDVVEQQYRFIAMAQAPSSLASAGEVSFGARLAIQKLQNLIDKPLLDKELRLISPSQPDGSGVDTFVATTSAGPALKTVIAGLLSGVSLQSVESLAESSYNRVVERLGLNDKRKTDEQIDNIVRLNPDLVLIAGGTEGGASRSIHKVLETIGLACYLLPEEKRPVVLFAGNQKLTTEVKATLNGLTPALHISPNIRPSLEVEDLEPAQREQAAIFANLRRKEILGMEDIYQWSGGTLLPSAYATGRMIRFLGQMLGVEGGILGVDLGASATTVSSWLGGKLSLSVFQQFGMGQPLAGLLRHTSISDIARWLTIEISNENLRDYIYQKALYPATLPATAEDMAIEEAIARENLRLALDAAKKNFPESYFRRNGLLPDFQPIIASGGVLAGSPTYGQALLMLLDGLQPFGITKITLDQHNVLPALGAASEKNTILPVHVLDSWPFVDLAHVVSPYSNASYGTPILRARMIVGVGEEYKTEVKQGGLEALPLLSGQTAKLELQPLQRGTDIGLGAGKGAQLEVNGSALGVVIDARGRPLNLPDDAVRRRELIKKWLWTLGG